MRSWTASVKSVPPSPELMEAPVTTPPLEDLSGCDRGHEQAAVPGRGRRKRPPLPSPREYVSEPGQGRITPWLVRFVWASKGRVRARGDRGWHGPLATLDAIVAETDWYMTQGGYTHRAQALIPDTP